MNDAFLMRVLNRLANLNKQVQPFASRQVVLVTVVGDFDAAHQFHDEVGTARVRRAGLQDLGNIRMIHQRQRLALSFEAGDDLLGVHAQLDDLEGDHPPDRFLLLSHVHHATAALANLLKQFVMPDLVPRFLRH